MTTLSDPLNGDLKLPTSKEKSQQQQRYKYPMKIAITAIHYALVGGTERYLYNLVAGFKALGDSVDVYIYGKQTEQSCDQVKILRRPIPKIIPKIFRQRIFVNRTRQLKQLDYDLTISLARTSDTSLTIAGSTHIGYTETINKKLSYKDKLTIKMERESYTSCKNLISHSQQIAEELKHYYQLPQRKITNIYPPLDHQKFLYKKHQLTQSTRERFGVSPNKTVFLFPSTGHWRKGLYELLAAFKSLDPEQTELLIVGSKPKNICPPDNVKYLGLISDMPALYAASDYTILPSKYEPFGYIVRSHWHVAPR